MVPPLPHAASTPRSFAILPAAGRSVRMGIPKLLLPWGDRLLIQHVLAVWLSSRVERVLIVVRADDAELQSLCARTGAEVIVPEVDPPEMKASVQVALRTVERRHHPRDTDAWLLAPADMPRLTTACIDQVLEAYDPREPSLIVPRYQGQRGHPILLPWRLAAEVRQLSERERVRSLLDRWPVRAVESHDAGVLRDVDTPHDYRDLRAPDDGRA